ncbi:UNVERIFIED_CONTAM: hypothetical protein HDU68_003483 [Siphonaria sp. JEL0065]|nr:hypothetical protein HDU68_003483 [Siphonaria sp. JEL0065]
MAAQPSRTKSPLPSIGQFIAGTSSSTPASPLRKLTTVFGSQAKELTKKDSNDPAVKGTNLTCIPTSDAKSSTLPRKMPSISRDISSENVDSGLAGGLRRTSAAGNVVSEYSKQLSEIAPNNTLKRMSITNSATMPRVKQISSIDEGSSRLKRTSNSGDMLAEYKSQTESCPPAPQMPKVESSKNDLSTESGILKRISGSGDMLGLQDFLKSEVEACQRKQSVNRSTIPTVHETGETDSLRGLKRSTGSGNVMGDANASQLSSFSESNQGSVSPLTPKIKSISEFSEGALKRTGGNIVNDGNTFPDESQTSNENTPMLSKARQLGQIEVKVRRTSSGSVNKNTRESNITITSPVAPKLRQLGQMGVNLHQHTILPTDSGSTKGDGSPELRGASTTTTTPSDSNSSEFYSKNGLAISPNGTKSSHFTWNFGSLDSAQTPDRGRSETPRNNDATSHSLRASTTKRPHSPAGYDRKPSPLHHGSETGSNDLSPSPISKVLSNFPSSDSNGLKEESLTAVKLSRSPSLPRPPVGSRSSTHVRRRSVKPGGDLQQQQHQRPFSAISHSQETQQAVEDYLHYGFTSSGILLGASGSEEEFGSEPALLAKRKQMEEIVTRRVMGVDGGDVITLSKMHGAVIPFLSRQQVAKHRWRYSIYCIVQLVRGSLKKRQEFESATDLQLQSLVFQTRQSKSDTIYTAKVRALLMEKRTPNIIKAIQKLLFMRSSFMYHLSSDQQLQLCGVLQFVFCPKGSTVAREGNERKKHNTLSHGDTFGNATKGQWTATVQCKEDTELLTVPRPDYAEIMDLGNEESISIHLNHLSQLPHFSKHQPYSSLLKPFASVSQLFTFHPQEPIIHEGVENFSVFWILSGTCRAVKLVPFLRQQTSNTAPPASTSSGDGSAVKKKKYVLAAYEPGVTPLKQGDKVVMQLITIRELGPGDHFPDMICCEGEDESNFGGSMSPLGVRGHVLSRSGLLARLNDTSPSRPDARAYVSIIANTKVEILGMTRLDYIRLASTEMILETMSEGTKLRVPLDALQKSIITG